MSCGKRTCIHNATMKCHALLLGMVAPLILNVLDGIAAAAAFSTAAVRSSPPTAVKLHLNQRRVPPAFMAGTELEPGESDDGDSLTTEERVEAFLDLPVFDPDDERNDGNWFAELVKSDYATAEALYASGFFAVMVLISQELFRWYIYGENYVPFTRGGSSGGGGGLW